MDEQGKHRRYFHGGARGVESFQTPAFFTTEKEDAAWYVSRGEDKEGPGELYEVYLNVKNPLDLDKRANIHVLFDAARKAGVEIQTDIGETLADDPEHGWNFQAPEIGEYSPSEGFNINDLIYIPSVREELEARGYDSISAFDVMTNYEIPVIIPFHPEQIKSINAQQFDPNDPRILYQDGYTGLDEETKGFVDQALEDVEGAEETRRLLDEYKDTPWAAQAIEGARARVALSMLLRW